MTTESFRKDVARKLSELQTNPDDTAQVAFPKNLTSSDRKYVHKIAESFKLPTQSQGVGDERYIVVYKTAPEGHQARRPTLPPSANLALSVSNELRGLLQDLSRSAPPGDGRPVLARVMPLSGRRLEANSAPKKRKLKTGPAPLAEGDEAEGYWPDDDTWLGVTVVEVLPDGSFRIAWSEDGSESEVPADYVRRPGGEDGIAEEVEEEEDPTGAPAASVEKLEASLADIRSRPGYSKIAKREELPSFKARNEIVETVRAKQVTLLSGETGCGKSTQVPQMIIDSCPEARVLVMQPRKLAAVTLAQRVAEERCQAIGVDVGYEVPFGGKSVKARLVFCTLGVFRRRLLHDPDLTNITHVIFDEVHERDKLADFNMIFMKDLLGRRPDLKLMLMSATLQLETFERYFETAAKLNVPGRVFPVTTLFMDEIIATLWKQPNFRTWLGPGILCGGISIPAGAEGDWNEREWKTVVFRHTKPEDRDSLWGLREKGLEKQMMDGTMTKNRLRDGLRKHDVLQQSSLAFDFPIIEALLLFLDMQFKELSKKEEKKDSQPGAILVFLPGWNDIDQLQKRLLTNFDVKRFKIIALHSQVSPEEQKEVFLPAGPGIRKIVLTTNIAEASITVDGTEYVIDCGRAKEVSYDPYLRVGTLTTSWVSQASAKQRAGRAGRTQGGCCFHLFCKERYEKLDEYLPPELLRSPLEDSALTAKLMLLQMGSSEKVSSFLMKAPDPPEELAVQNSLQLLTELGAFAPGEKLTALGAHLTESALPPRLAKTVLWAILFGCLDDTLSVVSATAGYTRDPFRLGGLPFEQAQEVRRKLAAPHNSDHACLLKAVQGFSDAHNQQAYCEQHKLAAPTMRQIRDQQNRIFAELKENKTEAFANRHNGSFSLLCAVLCAGIFPNVARRRGTSDNFEAERGKVEVRVHGQSAFVPMKSDEWVLFQEMTQVESSYRIKQVCPVDPIVLALFGGDGPLGIERDMKGGGKGGGQTFVTLLDGWMKFRTDPALADLLQQVRVGLQAAFQAFCQKPTDIPPHSTLQFLDKVASLIEGKVPASSGIGGGYDEARGVKRPAPWAEHSANGGPRPKYGGGGMGGGYGCGPKGGGRSFPRPPGGAPPFGCKGGAIRPWRS